MPFNILYKGRKIYTDLSHEECVEVLEEFSHRYYEEEQFDIHELEMEET